MFDISALKEMKLTELQDIAKASKKIKFAGVKKEALIAEILALQNPDASASSSSADDKPKRARITADKSPAIAPDTLFSAVEPEAAESEIPDAQPIKRGPKPKFNKAEYEKKQAMKAQSEQAPKTDYSQTDTPEQEIEQAALAQEKQPQQKPQHPKQNHPQVQNIPNGNQNPNFKNKKNPNFRDADFEFDGIIESEGVLEMMPDGPPLKFVYLD